MLNILDLVFGKLTVFIFKLRPSILDLLKFNLALNQICKPATELTDYLVRLRKS
jgi:hypothetical protein